MRTASIIRKRATTSAGRARYVIHTDFTQGSEPWEKIRCGRIGGISCASLLSGNGIDPDRDCCPECNSVSVAFRVKTQDWRCGSCKAEGFGPIKYGQSKKAKSLSEGAISLAYRKVGEIVTGPVEGFSNYWTERGNDLEPIARKRYEQETFTSVAQVGYISSGDWLGVSPDSVVFDAAGKLVGGVEIKCPCAEKFLRFMDLEELEPEHEYQCQWFLYLTGAEWIDFVMFHPDFKRDIIIKQIEPDADKFRVWDQKIPALIDEMKRLKRLAGLK